MSENAQANETFRSGYISIIGPTNAGKSTLLNKLVGVKLSIVSPRVQTTRNRVLGVKTTEDAQFIFVDTPGFLDKKYRGEMYRYIDKQVRDTAGDVDLSLLVLDASAFAKKENEISRVRASLRQRGMMKPDVVALNKVDLVAKDKLLPVMAELQELFSIEQEAKPEFVPIAARKGEGVDDLLEVLCSKLPLGPAYFPPGSLTDQPEQFFAAEIIREKLFYALREEIPYSAAVKVEAWEKEEGLERIGACIFVERDTQKGIVIGKGGAMLKRIGTQAREELERALGAKVFLDLRVKVAPDWSKSTKGLKKVGY